MTKSATRIQDKDSQKRLSVVRSTEDPTKYGVVILNPDGSKIRGPKGPKGDTGTISVGTTTTGEPGTNASVVNSGTTTDAILDFTIPRGDKGNGIASITSNKVDKTTTVTITEDDGDATSFNIMDGEGAGDVLGPNSSTDGDVVVFDGNTGKLIKDSGKTLPSVIDNLTSTSTTDALSANQGKALNTSISTINSKIPSAATSLNQLADKDFVNDGINSVTAYYITKNAQGDQFATHAELTAATTFYSGGVQRTPTRNDYCIVADDEDHDDATTRYIYNSGWEYQYTVNETPLTTAQLNALNSGITSAKVTTYDGYATGKQDALTSQTAYTSKGTSSKVPQITTNSLGQVTGITEVSIDYPTQVSDTAYASSWDGVTSTAPSKNAVYDKISAMDTTISDKQDSLTPGTGISISNNTISTTDPVLINKSQNVNYGNLTVGGNVLASGRFNCINIGANSYADGANATQIGQYSHAGEGGLAIGNGSVAGAYSIALLGSTSVRDAIQIGSGTNATQNTLQVKSYTMLDTTTGKIPNDRLNTGTSSGNIPVLDASGKLDTSIVPDVHTDAVTSVNGQTGAVTGLQTTANLKTSLTDNSDSYYPSQKAVKTAVDAKQDTLTAGSNITITLSHTDMQGPCDNGYHVPLKTEWDSIKTALTTLGIWTSSAGIQVSTYLKMPFTGYLSFSSGTYYEKIGSVYAGEYLTANAYYDSGDDEYLDWCVRINDSSNTGSLSVIQSDPGIGNPIRAIKDTPVTPDSSWTTIYDGSSTATGAGIFNNATLGLISISADGTTRYTIQDKNVGATTVWNYGDTNNAANCGKLFQRGNNHGFDWGTNASSTSSTRVDASSYGPGNYYDSSTFITDNGYLGWDTSYNTNLWGGVSQGVVNDTTISATDTTYESKTAASGGTDVSLVTTGEKYTWDNKQNTLTAGTGISISSDTISVEDPVLKNGSYGTTGALSVKGSAGVQGTSIGDTSLATSGTTAVGFYARSDANHAVVIGHGATINSSGKRGIAIGAGATVKSAGSIQLGRGENTEAGSFSVALTTTPETSSSYVNYKLLDVNGKIPNDRLNLYSAITVTLTTAGWSSNTQTVTATGVTASNNVVISPAPSSFSDYTSAVIYCSAQASNSLTFTCTNTPTSDITVNVLIMN